MPAVLTSRWGLGSVTIVANDGGVVPTSLNADTCSSSNSNSNNSGSSVRNQNHTTLTAPAAHLPTTAPAAAAAAAETAPITAAGTATSTTTLTSTKTTAATSAPRTTAPPSPPLLSPRSSHGEEEAQDGDYEEEPTGKTLWDCAKVLYDLVANPDPNNAFSVRGKRVIELGAGTGALSVGLARAGAASVTCTDLPCHLAYIKSTVEANIRSSSSSSTVDSCSASKLCRGANCSVSGENESDSGVANNNGCGGGGGGGGGASVDGGDGGGGGGGSDQTVARRESCPEDGKVHVVSLRWGEEEDIARARERSDQGVAAAATAPEGEAGTTAAAAAFDVIVLSEVLYWPALDLFQVDTRDPLRRTLVGLSRPGTMVVLIYKERWPEREKEFLASCEGSFQVDSIPEGILTLPAFSEEALGSGAIRAVVMVRLPKPTGC